MGDTKQTKTCTLPVDQFMHRFLQHVLPKGFVKVRYFGLFRPGNRQVLAQVRELLGEAKALVLPTARSTAASPMLGSQPEPGNYQCPACGAVMQVTGIVMPSSRSPPRLAR